MHTSRRWLWPVPLTFHGGCELDCCTSPKFFPPPPLFPPKSGLGQYWAVLTGNARTQTEMPWSTHYRLYSKSSLTLKEWRFNLSFPWVSVLFLNSWRVSVVPYDVTNHSSAIQKQHWHSREAQIEPPRFECDCEWAFRIQAYMTTLINLTIIWGISCWKLENFESKFLYINFAPN